MEGLGLKCIAYIALCVTVKASVTIVMDNHTRLEFTCSSTARLDIVDIKQMFCGPSKTDTHRELPLGKQEAVTTTTPKSDNGQNSNAVISPICVGGSNITRDDVDYWKHGTITLATLFGVHIVVDVIIMCLCVFLYRHDCAFMQKKFQDTHDNLSPDIISSSSVSLSDGRLSPLDLQRPPHYRQRSKSDQLVRPVTSPQSHHTFPRNCYRGIHRVEVEKLRKSRSTESPSQTQMHDTTSSRIENLFRGSSPEETDHRVGRGDQHTSDTDGTLTKEFLQTLKEEQESYSQPSTTEQFNNSNTQIKRKKLSVTKIFDSNVTDDQTSTNSEAQIIDLSSVAKCHDLGNATNEVETINGADTAKVSDTVNSSNVACVHSFSTQAISNSKKRSQIMASNMSHPIDIQCDSSDLNSSASSRSCSGGKMDDEVRDSKGQVERTLSMNETPDYTDSQPIRKKDKRKAIRDVLDSLDKKY